MRHICNNCGIVFYRSPGKVKNNKGVFGVFCSRDCYHEKVRKTYGMKKHEKN